MFGYSKIYLLTYLQIKKEPKLKVLHDKPKKIKKFCLSLYYFYA